MGNSNSNQGGSPPQTITRDLSELILLSPVHDVDLMFKLSMLLTAIITVYFLYLRVRQHWSKIGKVHKIPDEENMMSMKSNWQ